MKYSLPSLLLVVCTACSSLTSLPDSVMSSGYYQYHQAGKKSKKVYIKVTEDSLAVSHIDEAGNKISSIPHGTNQVFAKSSLDIDVLTVPFKYRPATVNLPRQLTADFNGNIYFGYRIDRFKTSGKQTPEGMVNEIKHRALTLGTFGGLGTSSITPWTTNNQTTDEYNGFIITRGLSIMAGVNNYTVGFGIGWDYLTDRDKGIWIYQNKAWYGVTVSLNIN